MDFSQYIKPELLVLVPVAMILGKFIKNYTKINNNHIPILLGLFCIALSMVWILGNEEFISYQGILNAVFTALIQGILCAGAAVYSHQVFKLSIQKNNTTSL